MKQWGVFTNFYNGITISNREAAVAFCDTEDAALQKLFVTAGSATTLL